MHKRVTGQGSDSQRNEHGEEVLVDTPLQTRDEHNANEGGQTHHNHRQGAVAVLCEGEGSTWRPELGMPNDGGGYR